MQLPEPARLAELAPLIEVRQSDTGEQTGGELLAIGVAAFFQVFHVSPFWRSVSIGALSGLRGSEREPLMMV